jgi:hypothetical protein
MTDATTDVRCPRCGSDDVLAIVYGEPSMDVPDIAIGGCLVEDGNPAWACGTCGHRF